MHGYHRLYDANEADGRFQLTHVQIVRATAQQNICADFSFDRTLFQPTLVELVLARQRYVGQLL
jgi:hypothetical protein